MNEPEVCCCFYGHVGVDIIDNDIKTLTYPEFSNKERKNIEHMIRQPDSPKCVYNLGSGEILTDPDKATDHFISRDFKDLSNVDKTPHDVMFAPPAFIYGEVTHQAVLTPDGRNQLSLEVQNTLKIYDNTLIGGQHEEKVYKGLREGLKDEKNIFVINGWKDNGGKNRKSREFDFLIISESHKTIIHIEVKTTMTPSNFESASKQLKNGLEFLRSNVPFPINSDWKYVRVMAFGDLKSSTPCESCKKFVLSTDSDIGAWWSQLKEHQIVESSCGDPATYKGIMKYLLHLMYRQQDLANEASVLKHTDRMIDEIGKQIIFLNSIQFSSLNTSKNKRVAFVAPFGTGKTTLLKAKAKELLQSNQKVIFLVFSDSTNDSILKLTIEQEFQGFPTIQVLQQSFKGSNILEVIKNNSDSNFLMDEVLVGEDGMTTTFLNSLAKEVDVNHHLWFACQSQTPPRPKHLKEYFVPELIVPLRYPGNLLKTCVAHRDNIGGVSWPPKGFNPDDLLSKGNLSLILALKPNTAFIFAVRQLAFILEREVAKTIIKIESDQASIIKSLRESSVSTRLLFEENPDDIKEFISSKERILIVTSQGDSSLKGSEVPLLVVFSHFVSGNINENIFSRCKSKLIIVCDEDHANKIIPSNKSSDFGKVIPIHDELMPSSFEAAIREKQPESVYNFLIGARPIPVDIRNEASQTGLMIACQVGFHNVADELLDNENDPPKLEEVDSLGHTALHYASESGSLECLESLIKKGAFISATTNKGETALHLAAKGDHFDVVDWLIQQKCPMEAKTTYQDPQVAWGKIQITRTVLHLAVSMKHLKTVKCLLKNQADVNNTDQYGNTALHIVAELGCVEIARELTNAGANISAENYSRWTPLHLASINGHLDVVKYLVHECQADVHAKYKDGKTQLHLASINGHLDVVKYLVQECQADVHAKDEDGQTPLHLASRFGQLDVVKYLVQECQADVHAKDDDGQTPLHLASEIGQLDVVKYLVQECQADVHAKVKGGETPLHFASNNGQLDVVKYLVQECQADVHLKNYDGWTPLHLASNNGQLNVVKYLVQECQADVHAKDDDDGQTPLHLASEIGQLDVVKYLVQECQADVHAKDNDGKTPLQIASKNNYHGCSDVVEYLKNL